jgi:hypothetical protein
LKHLPYEFTRCLKKLTSYSDIIGVRVFSIRCGSVRDLKLSKRPAAESVSELAFAQSPYPTQLARGSERYPPNAVIN